MANAQNIILTIENSDSQLLDGHPAVDLDATEFVIDRIDIDFKNQTFTATIGAVELKGRWLFSYTEDTSAASGQLGGALTSIYNQVLAYLKTQQPELADLS